MSICFWVTGPVSASPLQADEDLIFFPTNAYWDDGWVLPVRGWVFEPEKGSMWRRSTIRVIRNTLEVDQPDRHNRYFTERARMFLVDNERNKDIKVKLGRKVASMDRSKPNGHFKGEIRLSEKGVERLVDKNDWIQYEAELPRRDNRRFVGEVQLLYPEGVSIISDIDDTIKISRVARKRKLIKNTFLKKYRPVAGMARLYRLWAEDGASFHYVSGSPWQLYPALSQFIKDEGFPKGSFNLRRFRVKDESFTEFFKQPQKQKTRVIDNLLRTYPDRTFVLVGDSTESDPEIYAEFAKSHPRQVRHILIRDVKDNPMDRDRIRRVFSDIDSMKWTIFVDAGELIPREAM
ncbi:MAG: DUF2183 domain-containing protein [Gammaproteobacteria bacterium]|nr:DUF2183 domain-containing protein [Gammaproteobacteria bacterium]MDH5802524.1 DUF2183 domain-containing protein [Gammaproteobacteria bacterium]